MRSSSAPGPSPTIITGAFGLPAAKTVFVAVRFNAQPSNAATAAASASTVSALAASRRADCAASASDSVRDAGGDAGVEAGLADTDGADAGDDAATPPSPANEGGVGWGSGANRFTGSAPIASSAPISTYQRNRARAFSASPGLDEGLGCDITRKVSSKEGRTPDFDEILYSGPLKSRRPAS